MRANLHRMEDGLCVLRIGPVPLVLINALRRCILRDVPTLAVTRVIVKTNSTNFWDEYISHRVALLPFRGEPGTITLDAHGTSPQPVTVLSSSIIGDQVHCALPDVPLLRLMEAQRLHLQADVGFGTGKQHARFAPGVCWITNTGDDEYDLHLEPRDGLDGVAVIREGLARVALVIDRMLDYSVLSVEPVATGVTVGA
jgi:hypothetical protein